MTSLLEGVGGEAGINNLVKAPGQCIATKNSMFRLYDASVVLEQEFGKPRNALEVLVRKVRRFFGWESIGIEGALSVYLENANHASGFMQRLAASLSEDRQRLNEFSRKSVEEYGSAVSGLKALEAQAETVSTKYRAVAQSLSSMPHSSPEHTQYWLAEHVLREKLQESSCDRVLQAARIPRLDSMIAIATDVAQTMSLAITYTRLAVQHTKDNTLLVQEIAPAINDYLATGKSGFHLALRVAELHNATKVVVGAFGKAACAMAHVYQEATGASPAALQLREILNVSRTDAEQLSGIASEQLFTSCAEHLNKKGLSYDFVKTKEQGA